MAITVSNLRITPYTQKDVYKPIFGDRLTFAVTLPTPHMEGDRYALGCDYERVVFPPARPLCAYTDEFSIEGGVATLTLLFATARFRDWVSTIKKPMPIYLQMVRLRGETQETLLLDDILALPSVVDGQNVVCEGDPLQELLDAKQDAPAQPGRAGQVLGLSRDRQPAWLDMQGGGTSTQADWDESDSDSPAYIQHKPPVRAEGSPYAGGIATGAAYIEGAVQQGITVIPSATTAYTLAEGVQSHTPTAASTYTFPAVSDATRTHQITLIIDFTTVQTYSFLDANGDAIVPLFTPSISAGDVYEFRCEYSTVQSRWLIYPCKQGAVADDFVMRGEVGAANGVAGLTAKGLVYRSALPIAGDEVVGALKANPDFGVRVGASDQKLRLVPATTVQITNRLGSYLPITAPQLNHAVKAALTDANKIQLTDAQKATACGTLGAALQPLVLSAAPTTSTVGAVGQFAIDVEHHKVYSCEAITNTGTEETPVYEYTWRENVLLGGNGKVDRSVLPIAGMYSGAGRGVVTWLATYGIDVDNNGIIRTLKASNAQIDNKTYNYHPIVPSNLNYAVRSVLPNVTVIPAATTSYSLLDASATTNSHSWQYTHTPSTSAPTYVLPAVTNNTVAHEIVLAVKFSAAVLTCAFEDADGAAVAPSPAITPVDGQAIRYVCEWEPLLSRWCITAHDMGIAS